MSDSNAEKKIGAMQEVTDYLKGEGISLAELATFQQSREPAKEGDAGLAAGELIGTGPVMSIEQLSQKFYELQNKADEIILKVDNFIHSYNEGK